MSTRQGIRRSFSNYHSHRMEPNYDFEADADIDIDRSTHSPEASARSVVRSTIRRSISGPPRTQRNGFSLSVADSPPVGSNNTVAQPNMAQLTSDGSDSRRAIGIDRTKVRRESLRRKRFFPVNERRSLRERSNGLDDSSGQSAGARRSSRGSFSSRARTVPGDDEWAMFKEALQHLS